MFYNCKSLQIFYRIPKEENFFISENEIKKGGQFDTTHSYYSNENNNQLSYNFYHFNEIKKELKETFRNKNKSFNYRNKLNLIYIHSNNKNNLSDDDKKKMNEIIIKSNNFLLNKSSFDLFECQNNNINENFSIDDCHIQSTLSEITKGLKDINESTSLNEIFYFNHFH